MSHADELSRDDPLAVDVREMIDTHLRFNKSVTPPEEVYAIDALDLVHPDIEFFSFRRDGALLAIGALKRLDEGHAELKSIHTAAAARGQGIGARMIGHLVSEARRQGFRRVSLETGTMAEFEPARRMYTRAGFAPCEPFAQYRRTPYSACLMMTFDEGEGEGVS